MIDVVATKKIEVRGSPRVRSRASFGPSASAHPGAPKTLALPAADRRAVVERVTKASAPGGFAANALAAQSPISLREEAMVVLCLGVCMGGPLLLLPSLLAVLVYGSWTAVAAWIFIVVFLAAHPVPACAESLRSSSLAMALYRYFSYRFVWSGDAKAAGEQVGAWIGAGPPHGVLPFANVLSIPAINTFSFCKFVGAGASVVAHTPFLRYMALFGMIDVSAKSIARSIGAGVCVGTVPDGIAGIFKCSESAEVDCSLIAPCLRPDCTPIAP